MVVLVLVTLILVLLLGATIWVIQTWHNGRAPGEQIDRSIVPGTLKAVASLVITRRPVVLSTTCIAGGELTIIRFDNTVVEYRLYTGSPVREEIRVVQGPRGGFLQFQVVDEKIRYVQEDNLACTVLASDKQNADLIDILAVVRSCRRRSAPQ